VQPNHLTAVRLLPGGEKGDTKEILAMVKETIEAGKTLGAICVAPAILAKAGVLSGKKATVWSSALDKSIIKILNDSGAICQSDSVVADGGIVTASGPDYAEAFALKIIDSIK